MSHHRQWLPAVLLLACALVGTSARAEVIEEIVAWVNGHIITRSEFEGEEQAMIAEAYRRYAGDELDRQVRALRESILMQMIDRKILLDYAQRFDLDKMRESYYEMFKQQQKITNDDELERILAKQGLTVEELKDRLIESFAPDDVIRFEVLGRVSVGDREVDEYYQAHPEEFTVPAEAQVREIVLLAEDPAARSRRRPEIEAIRRRVTEGGEDFATVASEVSEAGTKDKGGLLDPIKRGDLTSKLDHAAFGTPIDGVSNVIETEHGYHLLKVEQRSDDHLRPLDEVRETVRNGLENRKYVTELEAFLKKARTQADWCVKPAYRDRLPEDARSQDCQSQ